MQGQGDDRAHASTQGGTTKAKHDQHQIGALDTIMKPCDCRRLPVGREAGGHLLHDFQADFGGQDWAEGAASTRQACQAASRSTRQTGQGCGQSKSQGDRHKAGMQCHAF